MNATSIAEIKGSLLNEKQRLEAAADSLRGELEKFQQDVRRIDGAIAALEGFVADDTTKRRTSKGKSKRTVPVAGKLEVMKYMEMILHDEKAVDEQLLKLRVAELAQQDGYSRLGLGLRIKQALTDSHFARTVGGIVLSAAPESARTQAG